MKTVKSFMATVLTGFLLSGLALTGCKEDPSVEDPIDGLKSDYLIDEMYQNGVLTSKWEYNNDNLLEKILLFEEGKGLVATTLYTYNNKGFVTFYEVHAEEGEDVVRTEFTYNGDKIATSTILNNGEPVVTMSYSYQGNKVIVTHSHEGEIMTIQTYTIEGQHIVREELVIPASPEFNQVRERWDFVDGLQPVGRQYGMVNIMEKGVPGREKVTSSIPGTSLDWDWKYTLNKDGYITTATNFDHASGEKIDFFEYKLIRAK